MVPTTREALKFNWPIKTLRTIRFLVRVNFDCCDFKIGSRSIVAYLRQHTYWSGGAFKKAMLCHRWGWLLTLSVAFVCLFFCFSFLSLKVAFYLAFISQCVHGMHPQVVIVKSKQCIIGIFFLTLSTFFIFIHYIMMITNYCRALAYFDFDLDI